jgi:hypothetical protein
MRKESPLVERFHGILLDEIRRSAPEYLESPFTVAEIYQSLVPYRTHRDRLGVRMNGDYEDALLRLLAGEGDFLVLESEPARTKIRRELDQSNPNTGIYREFAALGVRLNPNRVPTASLDDGVRPPRDIQTTLDALGDEGRAPSAARRENDAPASRAGTTNRPGVGDRAAPGGAASESPARCPECDEGLPERENLRYCPRCGANLRIVACRHCGEPLERGWDYCVACGEPAKG